jgi:Fibronectin type III-like domain
VSFTVTPQDMSWWNETANGWTQTEGSYGVYLGDSSALLPEGWTAVPVIALPDVGTPSQRPFHQAHRRRNRQAAPTQEDHQVYPVAGANFGEQVSHMGSGCVRADVEQVSDLCVGHALANEREDLALTFSDRGEGLFLPRISQPRPAGRRAHRPSDGQR